MAVKASNFITLTAVVDVSACFRYYLLQSSTLAKPAKPTAKPPGGSWTDAEPSYTAGSTNSLYFVDLTVFSDGTWAYSAVSLSSSYEAAKEAYNRAVAAQATAQQALSNTEVIVGTQTAATGAWTGVASFSSLQDGQQIVYWLPYAGSGNASLNLTLADGSTTGAKPCYYSGSSRITTHYAAGNAIHLTYRVNANVNGTNYTGWWADANWNTDTTDRMRMYNSILAASAITAGYLIVGTSSGYSHLAGGITFDVNRPILYPGSAISSGSTGNNNYLSFPSVNLRNIMGSSWSGTTRATAYIAGSLNGTSFTTQSSGCITTSPTTEGTYYISLGYMPNTYQMYLYPEHPIYICYGGTLRSVSQVAYQAQLDATHAQTTADAALPQVDFQRVACWRQSVKWRGTHRLGVRERGHERTKVLQVCRQLRPVRQLPAPSFFGWRAGIQTRLNKKNHRRSIPWHFPHQTLATLPSLRFHFRPASLLSERASLSPSPYRIPPARASAAATSH